VSAALEGDRLWFLAAGECLGPGGAAPGDLPLHRHRGVDGDRVAGVGATRAGGRVHPDDGPRGAGERAARVAGLDPGGRRQHVAQRLAEPGRAVVAGQGLAKVSGPQGGGATQRGLTALVDGVALDPGSPDAQIAHWASQVDADPQALLYALGSLVPTPEDDLRRITTPTLVVIGDRDERSDADELAALLPAGRYVRVPGGHGDAFAAPEFAAAIKTFLTDRTGQSR